MVGGAWKGVYPLGFGRSRQLLNKFCDPSTPSMRKVDDGEKTGGKIMVFIVATNVVASRPPKRRPIGTPHARANTSLSHY